MPGLKKFTFTQNRRAFKNALMTWLRWISRPQCLTRALVFLNRHRHRHRHRVKVMYWERNDFCLWFKRLESERFKTSPDERDEAIVVTVQELNWLLDGFDLWRNRPHKVLAPKFVV